MAFNFNWSPLATDASFYERAKEMLTAALNRANAPSIIVGDFEVSEFNLGEHPPDLEIVEIGDLAEDKFRGTFKMRYQGDAVLSLKTKVQANPLNNYLATRNAFATPQPLAAATGLTIPLQITLSEIRLSGFVILVFSKQKGLTIVFKDDPLESLRVSSTFDSIPFVANHIQGVIDKQLRNLLMEELPAIIHRLSQRFSGSEPHSAVENEADEPQLSESAVVDPFASPPQDPVDSKGNVLSSAEIASLTLDSSVETQSLFSQKNLIRLATLSDSHRTLSLFTPSIRDAVFRAWTGPLERGEMPAFQSRAATPALSRTHSHAGSLSTFTGDGTRPSLYSFPSTVSSHGLGAGRHGKTRKRKKRVVNLRKQSESGTAETIFEDGSTVTDSASVTESTSEAPSVFSAPPATTYSTFNRDHDLSSPVRSPSSTQRSLHERRAASNPHFVSIEPNTSRPRTAEADPVLQMQANVNTSSDRYDTIRARRHQQPPSIADLDITPRASMVLPEKASSSSLRLSHHEALYNLGSNERAVVDSSRAPVQPQIRPSPSPPLPNFMQFVNEASESGSIAERAWMAKMAAEMSRRYDEERRRGTFEAAGPSRTSAGSPPPAYYAR